MDSFYLGVIKGQVFDFKLVLIIDMSTLLKLFGELVQPCKITEICSCCFVVGLGSFSLVFEIS